MLMLLTLFFGFCSAQKCPSLSNEDLGDFCAMIYYGKGHSETFLGCTGGSMAIADGQKESYSNATIGSIVVNSDCSFKGFEKADFAGKAMVFNGSGVFPCTNMKNDACLAQFGSYFCTCQDDFNSKCEPNETEEEIAICDARAQSDNLMCTYSYTFGLSSHLSLRSKHVLLKKFANKFGVPNSSEKYSWSTDGKLIPRSYVEATNTVIAEPGQLIKLKQVIGNCGDIIVRTKKVLKVPDKPAESCTPTDLIELVVNCKATEEVETCSFSRGVGIEFETPLLQKFPGSLFKKFADIKNSSTGYNWEELSQQVKRQLTFEKESFLVPAGVVARIEQVVGYCGQNRIMTDDFRRQFKITPSNEFCIARAAPKLVARCNGKNREAPFQCTYLQKVGTNFPLVNNSQQSSIWFTRIAKLGSSYFYNWSKIPDSVQQPVVTSSVSLEVTAGSVVEIYQVVGQCGIWSVWTDAISQEITP